MRIFILFIVTIIGVSYAAAQPVLTEDWFYAVGNKNSRVSYAASSQYEPQEGMNFVWDISDISDNYNPQFEAEQKWVNANELNYFNEFPLSEIGYKSNASREYYFKVIDGEFRLLGAIFPEYDYKREYYNGNPILAYENFSFGDIEVSNYTNARIKLQSLDTFSNEVTDEFSYVGFGTVITPIDTYDNCVMTKLVRRTNNSPEISRIEYYFHKDKLSNIIGFYSWNSNAEPSIYTSYKIEDISSQIDLSSKLSIEFSRTSFETICLNSSERFKSSIRIFDSSGLLHLSQDEFLSNDDKHIDISQLNSDHIYFVLVTNTKTGAFKSFKFYK